MKTFVPIILFLFLGLSCVNRIQHTPETLDRKADQYSIRIAVGSCNKVDEPNVFWDDIAEQSPEAFVWLGDIVYADSNDISVIQSEYNKLKEITSRET